MITRRNFIIATGVTALASTRVFGTNDRLRIGVIGAGHRMEDLLDAADRAAGANYEIAAVADVYGPNRDAIKERSKGLASVHLDYREVLDKNIDAVIIASPDHWHAPMAVDALKAGKDVYLEKPVTHTIEEGTTLTKAVRSGKQILQCGMQQRSWTHFRDAVELIQAGSLGRVVQVRTYWWQNYQRNGPSKPLDQRMMASSIDGGGLEFRGTEATLKIDRGGFTVYREGVPRDQNPVLNERSYRDGTIPHMENFFDCIKTRKEPNAPVETGVAAARAGQIGNLAYSAGAPISWPKKA